MEFPGTPPADHPTLIEEERGRLLATLGELQPEDWQAASTCPGWSVLDLAVHLLGDDLGVLARDRDGYFGTKPSGLLRGEEDFVAFIDGLNDSWVKAGRRLSPLLVMELLAWSGEHLVSTYRRQDQEEPTAEVSWASDAPVPRWLDHARELTERWVHHQQILHGLGRPSWLEPQMTAVVLDTFSWAYRYRLSRFHRPPGTAVEVETTGVAPLRWRFAADRQGWNRERDPASRTDAVVAFVVDSDVAWRLLTNGIAADRHPEPTTNHDPELAEAILSTRGIIGLPNR